MVDKKQKNHLHAEKEHPSFSNLKWHLSTGTIKLNRSVFTAQKQLFPLMSWLRGEF